MMMIARSLSLALLILAPATTTAFVTPRPVSSFTTFRTTLTVATTSSDSATATTTPSAAATTTSEAPPLPMAPLTLWGDKLNNIRQLQEYSRKQQLPEFTTVISAKELKLATPADQLAYVQEHRMELLQAMQDHAAVIFRDFELMKTQDGFQQFYGALQMKPCLDPLHSVSARPTVDGKKNSAVYEAVNKESRKNFFIGMHNEFVGTRAPRAAAFCCFKAAEVGGEFLVADGRRIFRDLNPDLVEELYNRQIRYSVMELPFFKWMDPLPSVLQEPLKHAVKALISTAINAKVDFDVELLWGEGGYDNVRMLQARAPKQPPIVVHPTTGDPTWFCNVHSHSSKLRHQRESVYGAERFEDGASQINKSDMFFGDDGELTEEQLNHLDEVTMKNVKFVKMSEGDVVLLDNYKCLHGRNVFDGTRKHGVAWFEGWEGEEEMKQQLQQKFAVSASK